MCIKTIKLEFFINRAIMTRLYQILYLIQDNIFFLLTNIFYHLVSIFGTDVLDTLYLLQM